MNKNTLVLGASENPDRYSNKAIKALVNHGIKVFAIGRRPGKINEIIIKIGPQKIDSLDTVTIYLNAKNQLPYYNYILDLKPRRIIFNPGAENPELAQKASALNILSENACTLVLLSTNQF